MSVLRALPAQPSLEFDRKEAKALLRRLRSGYVDALARAVARHASFAVTAADAFTLADAQLVIAREYGFASWPRLVQYHEQLARTQPVHVEPRDAGFYEGLVEAWITELRERRRGAAHSVAAYVPRFYGLDVDAVFVSEVSDEEVRLAVARTYGAPSWQVLMRHARATDDDAVARAQSSAVAGRPTFASERLCGHVRMSVEEVDVWLSHGADPAWIAPNGYSVLEHALLRYWNGDAVDHLARRLTPPFRDALWVAAGLGDVDGTLAFLDERGLPHTRVRDDRPPFDLLGPAALPALPEPSGADVVFEAFVVAMLNGRVAVLDALCVRGFDVNLMLWDVPLVNLAALNGWRDVFTLLVRHGADLDVRGWRPSQTAREILAERGKA